MKEALYCKFYCDVMMMQPFQVGSKLRDCSLCLYNASTHMFVFTLLDILCLCVYTNTAALLPPFNSPPGHTAHTPTPCAIYLLQPRIQVSIYIIQYLVWSITIIIQTRKEACVVHMSDMCQMPFPLKTQETRVPV